MRYIYLVLIFIAAIFIILSIKNKSNNKKDELQIYPFKKKYILTKNEYKFYKELRQLTDPKGYQVLTKIRLADIIDVDKSKIENNEYFKYFNKIQSKHIDFVICDKDLNLLMAVELDDNSHNSDKAKKSDDFKNKVLESADIKLVRCRGIEVIKGLIN